MKKIIGGKELEDKMIDAITLLCDTVKITLGPKGRNVIIDHSDFSPFITNDGVTIALNIASDDEITNTILTLAKESSIKTNENVGDGTTTTLILLESIFLEGIKLVRNGYSPYILKQQLDNAVKQIIKELKKEKKKPTLKDIQNIASISANDKDIGIILGESYKEVGAFGINISDHELEETKVKKQKGYFFETIAASPYFFKNNEEIEYKNPNLLLINDSMVSIDEISEIINEISAKEEPLIIIAKDYEDNFVNEIMGLIYQNNLNIFLFKTPYYGIESYNTLYDLEAISKAKIAFENENITLKNLGKVESIKINKEETKISFNWNNLIEERLLKYKQSNDNQKISMLQKGTIEIMVGATTTTELREKKMRYIDALCAIKTASNGVLPGGGITYYKISSNLEAKNKGEEIIKEALVEPIKQLLKNASLNYEEILDYIKDNNYEVLYNVKSDLYENVLKTSVMDPYEVLVNSLKNATSIASLLLTTSSLVINENSNSISNNYTDL